MYKRQVYSKLKNDYPTLDVEYLFTRKTEENLEAVSSGRADACIINLAAATYYIQKKGLTNLRIAASVNWEGAQLCMGIRKDWPILESIIEKALASISQEEKDRITQRWIRAPYEPGVDVKLVWRWSLGIGLGILCLFFLFFVWNRRLKKEILDKEKAEQALRESEEKFRLAFSSSPDAVNINRLRDGLYVDINDGFTQLTGFTRQDVIGRTSEEIRIWGDMADRRSLVRALEETGICENLEARFRRKDGSLRTALMSARVISCLLYTSDAADE